MADKDTVRSVVRSIFDANRTDQQLQGSQNNFVDILNRELLLTIPSADMNQSNVDEWSDLVQRNLIYRSGMSIFDVYDRLERIARGEYHPKITFSWYANWDDFFETGNFFTKPDPLDAFETLKRIEEEFDLQITEQQTERMPDIASTVRFVWTKGNLATEVGSQ